MITNKNKTIANAIEKSLGAAPEKNKDKASKSILMILVFTVFFIVLVFTIGFTETVYRFTWQKETDSFESETKNVAYLANGRINEMTLLWALKMPSKFFL